MPHILLIAAYAPPSRNIGARRTANIVKHLARRGHRVTLVTSCATGTGEVEGASRTIRTRDLATTRLNWRHRQMAALSSGSGEDYDPTPSLVSRLLVPDVELLTWAPFARHAAVAVLRESQVDAVITTSPPLSIHLLGPAMQLRGAAWIADFRDGWSFEDLRSPFAAGPLRALDRRLERRVLSSADHLVGTGMAIAASLRSGASGNVTAIPNGFDPLIAEESIPNAELLRAERHRFVHTGRIGIRESALAAFLEAMQKRASGSTTATVPCEVVLSGARTRTENALLARSNAIAHHLGDLAWPDTLALQRSAGTLIVFTDERRLGTVPAKLFEYLAARRPILVVGPRSIAADIVEATATGMHVVAEPGAIAGAIEAMTHWSFEPDARAIAEYSWEKLVLRYEAVILGATTRRRRDR